jgi:hypothetical protein
MTENNALRCFVCQIFNMTRFYKVYCCPQNNIKNVNFNSSATIIDYFINNNYSISNDNDSIDIITILIII